MGRAIDLLITYRVIKMLVTPWKQHDAYKLGIIDDNGKVLRKMKTLRSAKEKDSYTILHRFVFNLKRLLGLLPGGKSKFASYATALALLIKENKDINAVELERGNAVFAPSTKVGALSFKFITSTVILTSSDTNPPSSVALNVMLSAILPLS